MGRTAYDVGPDACLMAQRLDDAELAHLLRRTAFGVTDAEIRAFAPLGALGYTAALSSLLNYAAVPDGVDSYIGQPGYVGVTARGEFLPAANITDARQRWLFRMVHSRRPLQEKMALFWHNHFATAYTKIAGEVGGPEATRLLAAKPSEDPAGAKGQLELLREHALGNFRDLLVAIAQDPAMLFWLDNRLNVRSRPQENFARELMELFTMGVGTFTENDVYAAARVFTGWNLTRGGAGAARRYEFAYVATQHDIAAKEFSFPIYRDGSRVIPARAASDGLQDGLDLIDAVARHPATGPRLARKLYAYFVNDVDAPDEALIGEVSALYYARGFAIEPMVRRLLLSTRFRDSSSHFKRHAWPVEFVVRALKEIGAAGFSVNDALSPLANMGQQLLEPPDVNGWELGAAWFSTGAVLARMNFAARLTLNQKFTLQSAFREHAASPETMVAYAVERLGIDAPPPSMTAALSGYLSSGGPWTGSDAQLATKAAGLVHLIAGSAAYQFI